MEKLQRMTHPTYIIRYLLLQETRQTTLSDRKRYSTRETVSKGTELTHSSQELRFVRESTDVIKTRTTPRSVLKELKAVSGLLRHKGRQRQYKRDRTLI